MTQGKKLSEMQRTAKNYAEAIWVFLAELLQVVYLLQMFWNFIMKCKTIMYYLFLLWVFMSVALSGFHYVRGNKSQGLY